jgi:hypothetical protein
MIKLFRHIRKNLLEEGKASKYFKYAIGEIVLVVIGILIALQVNNWNTEKNNKELGKNFLKDFKSDLETDIATLNQRIATNDSYIMNADSIILTLATKNELSNNELLNFVNQNISLTRESYFIPERTVIRQFEANSNGKLIASKKLKDKLFRYYSTTDRNENNTEKSVQLYQHNLITKNIMVPALSGDVLELSIGTTLNRPDLDLNILRQNTEYLFSLLAKKDMTTQQNINYKKTKATAEELIELIDKELEN